MKRYGLTGNPIGHSISDKIHESLSKMKNTELEYKMYPATKLGETFDEILKKLDGFNITVPYKKDILKFIDEKSKEVELYNACNTVKNEDGKLYGYNTDVIGFHDCFIKKGITFKGKNVLVTGAGGVSSMMAVECARNGANVFISCRNREKGDNLINYVYEKTGIKIEFVDINEFENIDIILQGTPLGMYPNYLDSFIPLNKLKNVPVLFDTVYNPVRTINVRVCEYYNNLAIGGLRMLVSQAAKGEEIWLNFKFNDSEISRAIDSVKGFIPEFKIEKNIILIGAPGSGKSTISREIAKILDMDFYDTDIRIVEKEKKTIPHIFKNKGENYFRLKETEAFNELIEYEGAVIATGGGLPEFNDLSTIDKSKNIIVFLDVDMEELFERVSRNSNRPLIKNDKITALKNIVERRYKIYEKYADVKIKVEKGREIKDTAVKVIDSIKESVL